MEELRDIVRNRLALPAASSFSYVSVRPSRTVLSRTIPSSLISRASSWSFLAHPFGRYAWQDVLSR